MFCASSSVCHWLICVLFNLLRMSLVGLCSMIVAFPRSSTFVCVVVVCLFYVFLDLLCVFSYCLDVLKHEYVI